MAKLNKIVRDNPISNFQKVASDGGTTFRLLAEAMSTAYDRVLPAAVDQMTAEGAEFGRKQARAQFGETRTRVSTRNGDDVDFDFSPYQVEGGARPDAITGLDGGFRGGLAAMFAAAPDNIRAGLKIGSAYRSEQRQAELWEQALKKYGSPEAARKWVAPPGRSNHNHGRAADLKFASDEVKQWVHQNAEQFGLKFPLANEPWHIEDAGTRGGTVTRVSTRNDPDADQVVVRTKDGNLEARKYSPYAGPILQAHDAAAKVAYQAEVMRKGETDLLDIAHQFPMDPDGFADAAESYVDSIVDQAPAEMRADLQDVLGTEAHRRKLGLMSEKQSDIRARANNSSRALVERWTQTYAEAIVSGDPYEVDAAQRRLDSILQAREALPGVSWTPEQSANVFLEAEAMSSRMMADRAKAQSNEYRDTFKLITKTAKEGRVAEGEEILDNPDAVAEHPELAREAAAWRTLRDNLPQFMGMTPAQQAATVAQLSQAEVSEEWELDVVKAAAQAAKDNRKAWQDDPAQRASEVLANTEMGPLPSLPDLTTEDPEKFVDALSSRKEYMDQVREAGYTDVQAYLTTAEAENIATFMGKNTPPEMRAAMAGAIVAGFGPDAVTVFNEIGGDKATMFAGKMMAVGGRPDIASQIFVGQQMLAENLVRLPPQSDRIAEFDGQMGEAFQGIPGAIEAQAEVMAAAQAIYASQAQGVEPNSEAATDLMRQSIQVALGQSTNKKGKKVGGVQTVFEDPTILPVGVNGEEAEAAIQTALGGSGNLIARSIASVFGGVDVDPDFTAAWEAAGSGVPQLNGGPIPREYIKQIRIIPTPDGRYRMELGSGAKTYPIYDANDNMVIFDLPKLMEALE